MNVLLLAEPVLFERPQIKKENIMYTTLKVLNKVPYHCLLQENISKFCKLFMQNEFFMPFFCDSVVINTAKVKR